MSLSKVLGFAKTHYILGITMFGCLLLFLLWALTGYAYYEYLLAQGQEVTWWMAILLGLAVTLFVAQIWGLLLAIRKSLIGQEGSPDTWQDGQIVALSGRLQALQQPMQAPASGRPVLIAEYEMRRILSDNKQTTADISGFLMAPCAISTLRGPIRLHGFPLLQNFSRNSLYDDESLGRFAKFCANTEFENMNSNPMAALKELNEILRDDDGNLARHFLRSHSPLHLRMKQTETKSGNGEENLEVNQQNGENEVRDILRQLEEHNIRIEEQVVEPGEEVTVFGSFQSKTRSINIGGGLQNLSHSIHPGSLASVNKKSIFAGIFGILFFGALTIGANYAFVPEIRDYLDEQYLRQFSK